jgi:tetratricopeptide (TPR) repeat protein/tRNA A-37 threonylcarbamoyl transferase component Bud32
MAGLEVLEAKLKQALRGRAPSTLLPLLRLKRACDRARPEEIDDARRLVESASAEDGAWELAPLLCEEDLSQANVLELERLCARLLAASGSDPLSDTIPASGDSQPASSSEALARGSALGRYLVVDLLGRGGMGEVYAAYDPELDRKIAVKVMRPEASARAHDTEGRARLLREAQAMARVSHPNVIAVYDVGLLPGPSLDQRVFIAMELVEGSTLRQWLEAKPRSWREIVGAFVQAGRGLSAAHAVGLVHRDFKPDNALVGSDGRVRVVDFGLVRAAGAREPSADPRDPSSPSVKSAALDTPLTRTGALMGTPAYMSPEQMTRDAADARSDQFSFCVALYQALYATRPFSGNDLLEVFEQMKQDRVLPPARDREVPARIHKALLRGLRYDAAARFPSMDALLGELAHDPSATRRRWLLGGAAVSVLALLSAGVVAVRHQQQSICKGGAARVAAVWDRTAVERAFTATGRPFAGAAFSSVARAFDGFAQRWAAMHEDACAATRLRGEQSEELLDLRMQCLARQLDQARASADLFAHADAKIVENAAKVALPAVEDCANVAALKATLRPPADAAARARVDAVREKLTRARALDDVGKFADGLPLAATAVTDAKATGYAPVEAEALVLLGQLQRESGDTAAALKTLADAVLTAEASHHDEVAARAWTQQVMVAYDEAKFADGRERQRWAEAAVARTGDDRLKATLENVLGALALEEGNFPASMAHCQEALRLRQKDPSTAPLILAATVSNIGNAYLQQGKLDEAIASYQQALAMKEKAVGKDHPAIAASFNNLANAYSDQRRYPEALDAYQHALAIWLRTFGPEHRDVGMAYMNIGAAYEEMGRYDEALKSDQRALEIYEKALGPTHPDVSATLGNIAKVQLDLGRPKEALALLDRARGQQEKALGPDHPDLASTFLILSEAHAARGEFTASLAEALRSLAILEKAVGKDSSALARTTLQIGEAQLAMGKYKAAVPPLERTIALLDRASPAMPLMLGSARFGLARALWDGGGDRSRARRLAEQALDAKRTAGKDGKADAAAIDDWIAHHAAPNQ